MEESRAAEPEPEHFDLRSAALEAKGWTVAGAVTRETILVVCDDTSGSSTKLKKAREAGIDIVTYEEFLEAEGLAST